MQNIVVVGASLAGLRAVETLRREGFAGTLTVVGEEPHAAYDRPPLSKEILVGEMQPAETTLSIEDGTEAEWLLGDPAVALDTEARVVRTAAGRELAYDGLILATGSEPRRVPGLEPDGDRVLEVRTIDDALRLRDRLDEAASILIVGGGFIGVEVASAARQRGITTTMVTLEPVLMPAGSLAGQTAQQLLEEHGVSVWSGRTVLSISHEGAQRTATLDDGTTLSADVIVVAIGVRPSVAWLEGSGIHLEDGIVCDEYLRALGAENVFAAGDVARWPNPLFGGRPMRIEHWSNAVEHGAAAAKNLLNAEDVTPVATVPSFWSDHFGIRLQSVGLPALADTFEVTHGDVSTGRFGAAAYQEGTLIGGVAYGMPKALISVRARLLKAGVTG